MDYAKITEAYGNLIKAIKEEGMNITVSKNRLRESESRYLFIKIKANKGKSYVQKD